MPESCTEGNKREWVAVGECCRGPQQPVPSLPIVRMWARVHLSGRTATSLSPRLLQWKVANQCHFEVLDNVIQGLSSVFPGKE